MKMLQMCGGLKMINVQNSSSGLSAEFNLRVGLLLFHQYIHQHHGTERKRMERLTLK